MKGKLSAIANFIAVDLGASSGRVLVGQWNGHRFSLEELHRFPNGGIGVLGTLYWDVLRIWSEIELGLSKYNTKFGETPAGISVDAWGVDFALLDRDGKLIGNPVHYRDARTDGMVALVLEHVSADDLYRETAIQTLQINTLFQLFSMVRSASTELSKADTLLMIPDLFHYFLSGEKAVEYSGATTTQMYSAARQDWARDLLQRLGLPVNILPRVIYPGSVLGSVLPSVYRKAGLANSFPVIAGASHDTASAVASIPDLDAESTFISSGTWSLMGVEADYPVTSEKALALNFTNEGGVDGSFLLLKNITGLWLLQECQRYWSKNGKRYSWEEILESVADVAPLRSILDTDAVDFRIPSNMPAAIQHFCQRTNQPVPETVGEIARSCLEGLCLKYRSVLEQLRSITCRELHTIRIVGGGSQNQLLSQWTADACECSVVCGPVEASALGNVMMQAVTTGHLSGAKAGRAAITSSVICVGYEPRETEAWRQIYPRFLQIQAAGVD